MMMRLLLALVVVVLCLLLLLRKLHWKHLLVVVAILRKVYHLVVLVQVLLSFVNLKISTVSSRPREWKVVVAVIDFVGCRRHSQLHCCYSKKQL